MSDLIRLLLAFLTIIPLGSVHAANTDAQRWHLARSSSGAAVARLEFSAGPVRAIELACLGTHVALGVWPVGATSLRAFPIGFQGDGGRPVAYTIPRMGSTAAFGAVLPDAHLIDGLIGGWTHARAAVAGISVEVALTDAPAVIGEALKGCYAAAPNRPLPDSAESPRVADQDVLPPPLAADIDDFDRTCRQGSSEGSFGTAVREAGAIHRADFNGDGIPDYLLDGMKMHCSKLQSDDNAVVAAAYTSMADGTFRRTLVTPFLTRMDIVPGSKASLRLRLKADEDDASDDDAGDVDETVSMTSATTWSKSRLTRPAWRSVIGDGLPIEVRAFFTDWEQRCQKAGRTMSIDSYPADPVIAKDGNGRPLDLNGDGKSDYFINATVIGCSLFSALPPFRGERACSELCGVVAVLSAPDGSYVLRPMPHTWVMDSSEEYLRAGNATVICFRETLPEGNSGGTTVGAAEVRYRWSGTTPERTVISAGKWKQCTM